jgi:hypothetical protein
MVELTNDTIGILWYLHLNRRSGYKRAYNMDYYIESQDLA